MVQSSSVAHTLQELSNVLKHYDMKRELVTVNHDAPQWKAGAMWNKTVMVASGSRTLRTMWTSH